jgi:hypothetical protein
MTRLAHAWHALEREQRFAAVAALGLFVSMFLPWYSKTDTVVVRGAAKATRTSLNAFQSFSFVEAAVLLVSAGVLATLFARAERRDFNLPGGDGLIVSIAGGWTAVLIFYRLLDKPGLQGNERVTATVGVEWGIFIALLVALGLVYAGTRIRSGERPEPPLHRSREPRPSSRPEAGRGPRSEAGRGPRSEAELAPDAGTQPRPRRSTPVPASERAPYPPAPPEQLSLDDPPSRPK